MTKNIFQKIYYQNLDKIYAKFDGIILDDIVSEIPDVQSYFENLRLNITQNDRVLISYHSHFWEPILTLASKLDLRKKVDSQNWLDEYDIENILNLTGFEKIVTKKKLLGLITYTIARPKPLYNSNEKYIVSIVIPARNEEGNISKILRKIPKFGKSQEIIFVEGNSTDNTWGEINKLKNVVKLQQSGKGKANAVWEGFDKASGDILMIYDADMTVDGHDLPKFYNALASNIGEFANGSRLVYPMEVMAMQTLNKLGNKIFSIIFTWIFGQRFKDTLCGTKALFRKDYLYMKKNYKKYFDMDPFGDFALIFGAVKKNLKIIEVPIRYRERTYGSTNISRFRHGLLLLKMGVKAFTEFKIY